MEIGEIRMCVIVGVAKTRKKRAEKLTSNNSKNQGDKADENQNPF